MADRAGRISGAVSDNMALSGRTFFTPLSIFPYFPVTAFVFSKFSA
jgi:hypothetical protein